MATSFIDISGILNIIAGVLLLVYWYAFAIFMPYRDLSTTLSILVENRNWTWINTLGVLGALFALLGQAGILAAATGRPARNLGTVGTAAEIARRGGHGQRPALTVADRAVVVLTEALQLDLVRVGRRDGIVQQALRAGVSGGLKTLPLDEGHPKVEGGDHHQREKRQ